MSWLLILGFLNLILFLFFALFLVPRKIFYKSFSQFYNLFLSNSRFLLIIVIVVLIHLIEVNLLDSYFTNLINIDFANVIKSIEGNIVYSISQNWNIVFVYLLVIVYIVIYPFTLWFYPLYFTLENNKKCLKNLSYGLLFIYAIALPFYLFLPITNVYTYYGLESALERIIPGIEQFFYSTTTNNNCFPSLHVAMTLLVAKSATYTKNKKLIYFSYFCAICVIISVIYLAIHWITDVIFGIILVFGVLYLLKKFDVEK